MSRMDERAVASKLAERDDIEPPAGLLEKIQSEIPDEIRVSPELVKSVGGAEDAGMPRRQRWLIAASLIAAVGVGVLGWELRGGLRSHEEMELAEAPVRRDAPAAVRPLRAVPEVDVQDEVPQEEARRYDLLREEPRAAAAPPASSADPGSRQSMIAPLEPQFENELEALPIPTERQRLYRGAAPAAPKPAPNMEHFRVMEEITVTGEADSLQSSSSVGANVSQRAAYRDVFFKAHGTNPFVDTEDDRLSTFGLDVDTGSYTVARRYLYDGHLPDLDSVRVEEWVNYFRYGDRPPARSTFSVTGEGAPTPFTLGPRYRLVRFNIRGREVDVRNRKPAVLTFVVDVSGSMEEENRLELVKESLGLLLDRLDDGDRIGLVIYGSEGEVLLEPSGDREAVRRAIKRLAPGGSTNAEEGLVMGYDVASRAFREGAINRVVLCSDGVANVGETGPEGILERIGREARRGIELTTLGFGMGNYNDDLMEQLANKGDGRYAYVDTLAEARKVLVEELTGTLQTIAKDAKVQVEWNPRTVESYRLLGYENRAIADERFRDDKVDAGEIGAGHSVTALYEIKLRPNIDELEDRRLATLRLRWRSPETGKVAEAETDLMTYHLASGWEGASRALRLAAVVAEAAEVLRDSYWAKGSSLETVFREAQKVAARYAGDVDVAEFVSLAGKAARLKGTATTEEPR